MLKVQRADVGYILDGGGRRFIDVAETQLLSLCEGLGWQAESQRLLELQRDLFEPWGSYDIPEQPLFPSLIGDDHSPYEYSLAFEQRAIELRILFEAQSRIPCHAGNLSAAKVTNQRLPALRADLSRLQQIEDLFLLADEKATFGLWHAVGVATSKAPEFKAYLNPAIRGASHAWAITTEALLRLGFSRHCISVLRRAAFRGEEDELRYFSLDLSHDSRARVKVYFAHHHTRVADLEKAFAAAPTHRREDVKDFCSSVLHSAGPFQAKPLTSCFSFVAGSDDPSTVTLHAPVAHYVDDDELVAQRVVAYLESHGLPGAKYASALASFAGRSLSDGPGMQSYASFRRVESGLRATIYLSPELFDNGSGKSCVRHRVL